MKKYILFLFLLSYSFYGQQGFGSKKNSIDSIVNFIENKQHILKESITEGEIISKKMFKKNGIMNIIEIVMIWLYLKKIKLRSISV